MPTNNYIFLAQLQFLSILTKLIKIIIIKNLIFKTLSIKLKDKLNQRLKLLDEDAAFLFL